MGQNKENIRIHLMDEIPKFGSGWRNVSVILGTKWAHLECVASGKTAKIKLQLWKQIIEGT
jgi:hypothetical protein